MWNLSVALILPIAIIAFGCFFLEDKTIKSIAFALLMLLIALSIASANKPLSGCDKQPKEIFVESMILKNNKPIIEKVHLIQDTQDPYLYYSVHAEVELSDSTARNYYIEYLQFKRENLHLKLVK